MKIAVIGSGGLGGFYGFKLVRAGHDVTFVARGAHLEAMRTSGLHIENESGVVESLSSVKVTDDILSLKQPDLILIAVKMWDLEAIASQIKKITGPDTAILSLQNGVIKDIHLKRAFGESAVMGGVAYVATSIGRPGVIKQVGPLQRIRVGEYGGRSTRRSRELVNAFASTGVDALLVDDIERVLWEKYAFLVGLSSMTCLTHLTIGPVREHENSRALLQTIFNEVVALGRARGVSLPEDYARQCMQLADDVDYSMTSSMYHDLEKGNRLELPWLSGGVVSLARENSISVPANTFVTQVLAPYVDGRKPV
ncbi:ketopantoate reductase family protein [Allopusillimonas ginsengisoli]|uniref:ketopantoate reductase family protein n=1 Tax=Allopusillimonas ginsengisoli TaxID=453575 RepID=UPI00101FF950|nr:2-dehydropantoate 2-reductase [Allopusillimonas ginsengisoli]TEA71935.1 2-dehydropantoate 2-reductase [Allopusillimonas ginsengisoli]